MAGPAHAVILNPTVKFIFAAGAAGGILWKLSNIMGSNNHYDHEMLGDGAKAPAAAKEAERLFRRHSSSASKHDGQLHPEAQALKQAA